MNILTLAAYKRARRALRGECEPNSRPNLVRTNINKKASENKARCARWVLVLASFDRMKKRPSKTVFWSKRRDSILARTARSVFHGRGRPPEVRSAPFSLRIPCVIKQKKIYRKGIPSFTWSKRRDSNPRSPVPEQIRHRFLTTFVDFLMLFSPKTMLSDALVRTVST